MKGFFSSKMCYCRFHHLFHQKLRSMHTLRDLLVVIRLYCPLRLRAFIGLSMGKLNLSLKNGSELIKIGTKSKKNKHFIMLTGVTLQFWQNQGIDDADIQNTINNSKSIFEVTGSQNNDESQSKLNEKLTSDGWEPVIINEKFQVWRKSVGSHGLYQYKVFGSFTDISASEFFTVQKDLEYRKTWDHLVIKLEVVDRDKQEPYSFDGTSIDYGNEIVHWIMHYPFPMYSRDYCMVRRSIVDYDKNFMVLVAKAVEHPNCPPSQHHVRVNDYESQMVIRPHKSFQENGFDYVLTYFDNPRAAFPSSAYNWMAASGVPDFVESLHQAALRLKSSKDSREPDETGKAFNNIYLEYVNFNYRTQEKT